MKYFKITTLGRILEISSIIIIGIKNKQNNYNYNNLLNKKINKFLSLLKLIFI